MCSLTPRESRGQEWDLEHLEGESPALVLHTSSAATGTSRITTPASLKAAPNTLQLLPLAPALTCCYCT